MLYEVITVFAVLGVATARMGVGGDQDVRLVGHRHSFPRGKGKARRYTPRTSIVGATFADGEAWDPYVLRSMACGSLQAFVRRSFGGSGVNESAVRNNFV